MTTNYAQFAEVTYNSPLHRIDVLICTTEYIETVIDDGDDPDTVQRLFGINVWIDERFDQPVFVGEL